jgi:uncharacterized membrane protein YraQ (UPF0718 family)
VLWNGGISFGGAISFIFADLIVIPILRIYRKYYGKRMTLFLFVTFYVTMAAAGLIVEILFGALGLIPTERNAQVVESSVSWNYTTVLNLFFLTIAAVLVARFLRTGGPAMLRAMSAPTSSTTPAAGPAVYTCPMHPEIARDEPGTCPVCGMDLVGTPPAGSARGPSGH